MNDNQYKMSAKVWLYPGMAGWHFASVPKKQSKNIRDRFSVMKRGWGSLPVLATIGQTRWKTSIFPDKKTGTYLLPLKASVRKVENITASSTIALLLEIQT